MGRSFRMICNDKHIDILCHLLRVEGYCFEPEPFSKWCYTLTAEPHPIGSSLAARFGLIYIQDRSSMLPPLALFSDSNILNADVLDMCSSPGSKTGFLAQLTSGFILANEYSRNRLATLRANMQALDLLKVSTCSYAAQNLPIAGCSFDFIQLDPPCSGWGTVEKNPQVMNLWQGDKIKPLIDLQRDLLRKAWELLKPNGQVVYSTCTTNTAENEEQVLYATKELGFELIELKPFDGFVWQQSNINGTLSVDGQRSQAQGFYIAKLRKPMQEHTEQHIEIFQIKQTLNIDMLNEACIDTTLLPKGEIGLFGDTARFIPERMLSILPKNFQWQAAPIGKVIGNSIRLMPRSKSLMPHIPPKEALVIDSIQDLKALLQGQSLKTNIKGRETGLYFASNNSSLPLGRITLKNGRALWSGK